MTVSPLLDNQAVVNELALLMRQKYQITKNPSISLSEKEVRAILAPMDLEEEVVEQIVIELK